MFERKPPHPGREALDEIGRALAAKPATDGQALSAATRCLAQFREELLAERRAGRPVEGERLAHLNAVIAVVMAMHFPIGQPPWKELEKAQGWLRDLLRAD